MTDCLLYNYVSEDEQISGNFHSSVYPDGTNKTINCKIKSTLRKIHKLKRENLVLSDRRKSIKNIQILDGFYRDDEFIVTHLPRIYRDWETWVS